MGQSGFIPPAPDHSKPEYWILDPKKENTSKADVFFIYPTLGNSFTDSLGNPMLYADITKTAERDAAQGNQRFNKAVYAGEDFNLFASFYRQNTMEVYPANQLNFQ